MGLTTYADRKGRRVCVRCEGPLSTRTLCEEHRMAQCVAMAPRTRRMRAWWRSQGLCLACGRLPVPGTKHCAACAERNAEWKQAKGKLNRR